ncbi:hypothetical protein EBU71_20480 [bacterium]|nr:hypothetical protein [Candidatus Elulimicrobium humile]
MSKEKNLVEKALLAINSSSFLEKIAEVEFNKMDELNNLPWSKENEAAIEETAKRIKAILQKSELELNNLSQIENEVNEFIKNKKPRKL